MGWGAKDFVEIILAPHSKLTNRWKPVLMNVTLFPKIYDKHYDKKVIGVGDPVFGKCDPVPEKGTQFPENVTWFTKNVTKFPE